MNAILCSVLENLKRGFEDDWMRWVETAFAGRCLIGVDWELRRSCPGIELHLSRSI